MKAEVRHGALAYHCPACKTEHVVRIGGIAPRSFMLAHDDYTPAHPLPDAYWWTGSLMNPTLLPAVLILTEGRVCHHRVLDGYLHYRQDCTHGMAASTIMMDEAYPDTLSKPN